MVKKIVSAQPILLVTVLISFIFFVSLHFLVVDYTLTDFVLLGLLLISILISILTNMTYGLIFSIVVVFGYTSLVFFESMISSSVEISPNYIWIFSFPLLTSSFGYLGDLIHDTAKYVKTVQNEKDALVTIDNNTGFGNIKSFYMDVEAEIARTKRHKMPLSIMIIEIIHVDELISLYGKDKFSNIIRIISNSITKASRTEDYRYRISEKAFALIMPTTDLEGATVLKNRIKEDLIDVNVMEEKTLQTYNFEVRIGVKQYSDAIKDKINFKKEAEKEVEYDV